MSNIITGAMLRKMVISGANYLEANKDYVDSLNVYPVPDGDTGTNMSLTMRSAIREVNMCTNNNLDSIADAISKGALRGARGNSGVILSQILKGFSSTIASEENINTKLFAKALKEGANIAYKAVTIPKEGTILTVIRLMSDEALKIAKKEDDCAEFLKKTIAAGEEVLKMTPDLLPVLKKAGVVDAGGQGLLVILSGFLKVLSGEEPELDLSSSVSETTENKEEDKEKVDYNDLADIEFAYCTEFFVININKKTTEADIDKLREKLMNIGDSVICIGDLNLIKVHVHTNDPGIALSSALKLGEVNGVKIENMLEQNRALKIQSKPEELKPIGTVSVCVGEGMVSLFKDLNVDYIIEGGQTMNPSAEDIAKACDTVLAETVFVFPNNKNIIPAAELANDLSRRNIVVIPTTSVPEGITAAISVNPEASVDENKQTIIEAIGGVKTGSITFAVKSTNIDGFKLKEGDIIGLGEKHIVAKGADVNEVCEKTVETLVNESSMNITLFYGKDVQEAEAEALAEKLREKYPEIEVSVHNGGQPLYYYL
ncbi:MAG: DAK2 domain-containing protein, partial [Clostridia bacterium]|nr:DAK2 domain-containing protein [Clostridia bacterium]